MSLSVNQNIAFRGNEAVQPQQNSAASNPVEKTQIPEKEDKKGLSTGAWIGLGALATAAIAGIAIAATHGRGAKAIASETKAAGGSEQVMHESDEIIMDMTKQKAVKFNHGKALLEDGTGYTGEINKTKDGKNIVIEYKDGILQKASKFDGKNLLYTYTY